MTMSPHDHRTSHRRAHPHNSFIFLYCLSWGVVCFCFCFLIPCSIVLFSFGLILFLSLLIKALMQRSLHHVRAIAYSKLLSFPQGNPTMAITGRNMQLFNTQSLNYTSVTQLCLITHISQTLLLLLVLETKISAGHYEPQSYSLVRLRRYTSTVRLQFSWQQPRRHLLVRPITLINLTHEVLEFSYARTTFIAGSATDYVSTNECRHEHISPRAKLILVQAQNISTPRAHDVLQSPTLQKKRVCGLGSYCGLLGQETVWSDRWMSNYRMNRHATGNFRVNPEHKGICAFETLITTALRTILWTLTAYVHIHHASPKVSFIRGIRNSQKLLLSLSSVRPHGTTQLPLDGFS